MVENISEEEIRKVVAQIKHPAIDRTLVDLGIVKNLIVKNDKATIILAFPFLNIRIKDYLVKSIKEPIEKLGAKVEVKLTVMNQEELQKFSTMEQEGRKGRF